MKKRRKNKIILIYNGLKYAHKVIDTRQCDMVVLDEVLGLLDLGLLKTEELVEMLENRSDDQNDHHDRTADSRSIDSICGCSI